jgi:hypothetical protein
MFMEKRLSVDSNQSRHSQNSLKSNNSNSNSKNINSQDSLSKSRNKILNDLNN